MIIFEIHKKYKFFSIMYFFNKKFIDINEEIIIRIYNEPLERLSSCLYMEYCNKKFKKL